MKNDKWFMFKNYMHNELQITREDIQEWIKSAIEEEARRVISQEFGEFNIQNKISLICKEVNWYGDSGFNDKVIKEVAKALSEKIKIEKI